MPQTSPESDRKVLTVNAGSSSVRYAVFGEGSPPRRLLGGNIDRVNWDGPAADDVIKRLDAAIGENPISAVGHRIVHGGPRYSQPQRVTREVIDELRRLIPFAPNHLPGAIACIEALIKHHPDLPHIACFDTAFHHDLPIVARILPIPRKYTAQGVRRYGFHGLSYTFLIEELARVAGSNAAKGNVIIAHLGNGASMAAVRNGKCIDTTMGFTPVAGLVMSTRTGDLDPGLMTYLAREHKLSPDDLQELTARKSGLLGISETSSDMRDLLAAEKTDTRAAEAVEIFCYQARKWIGAFAAALGGLDVLVFSGGMGEHASEIRSRICSGLAFLGIVVDPAQNATHAPLISSGPTQVRVIATNEELVIAKAVLQDLG
jgi:acetate kinase